MPTYIEITGLDESGVVGEDILFARVSVGLNNEIQLFLRNIDFFDMLLPSKFKIGRGFDQTHLLKYVKSMLDDSTFEIELFKMFPATQLRLTKDLLALTAEDLFEQRQVLLSVFDESDKVISSEDTANLIYGVTDILRKFRTSRIWVESFVKAYGMMKVVREYGNNIKRKTEGAAYKGFSNIFSAIQVAGGYPFAFWWRNLLEQGILQKGAFVASGVSNGDEHYPTMSAAGTIATSLMKNKDKFHLFPIKPIEYDSEYDMVNFFKGQQTAYELPIFQKRIIFLGTMNENLRLCIPYLEHLRDIHITPEATSVSVPVDWFFKARGYGTPENTVIIHSSILSDNDKQNIQFCKSRSYPIRHTSEYKKDFEDLVAKINSEIEYAPTQKRSKLSTSLTRICADCAKHME